MNKVCKKSSSVLKKRILILVSVLFAFSLIGFNAAATGITVDVNTDGADTGMDALELLFLFAVLSLAPSLLIMVTSFTRILIVFSFLRNALGLQQTPPNQVLVGIALFLTLFIMQPTISQIGEELVPYNEGEIGVEELLENVQDPLKEFMLKETNVEDLNLFLSLSGQSATLENVDQESVMDIGIEVIIPAFITSELKTAFTIGFLLFLPFLVIDMIVSSTLMSMGMVMLPPSMISLPFKLMLFVVVDGWTLIMEMLIQGFY